MQITVKTLFEKGYNKTQIGKMLGIDRKTVRKILKNPDKDIQIVKKPHPSTLDKHREFIEWGISKELSAQRIFQDLQREGFDGSYSTVRDYVKKLKENTQRVFMVNPVLPGEEAQVDFGDIGKLSILGKKRRAWIFVMTLSFSRYMFAKIVFDQTVKTFIQCHVEGFRYFCGIPETVKIDNLKAGIIEANFYEPLVQRTYAAFASHYGFWPQPCRVSTPTDKPKVERNIDYVKDNCLKGRDFKDADEATEFLKYWLKSIANARVHGTTKKIPAEVFEAEEKPKLKVLPSKDFVFSDSAKASIHTNCHFSYKANYYSAPFQLVGLEVDVIEVNKLLKVYYDQKEVAIHPITEEKGKHVTNKDHYPDHKNLTCEDILAQQREEMALIGESALEFFDRFRSKDNLRRYDYRTISGILSLRKKYDPAIINAACQRALYYDCLKYITVKKVCEKDLTKLPIYKDETYINEESHDLARDLSEYNFLCELGEMQ